jgi:hypothetical protein
LSAVPSFFRKPSTYKLGNLFTAAIAAAAATAACSAITLAVITLRLLNRHEGMLGKGSRLDPKVIAFVSNFQTGEATTVLFFGTLALAFLLKSEFLVPMAVLVASVVNAWTVAIPPLGDLRAGSASQAAQTLSTYDAYLFRIPPLDVLPGSFLPLVGGFLLCGIVGLCAGRS